MAIEYVIDKGRGVTIETWLGEVSADDLASHWRRLLTDPEALAIRRTLADLRGCDLAFTGTELAHLVKSIAIPMLDGRTWKSAILVDKPVQFGVSRQYQVFAEGYSQDAIFDDAESAMRWLCE